MAVEIITRNDLEKFRTILLEDIKNIVTQHKEELQKWLKSYQVKNITRNFTESEN